MVLLNPKVLYLFPMFTMLIKSQGIDPMISPVQKISTTESENNNVYLWSTSSAPEIKQTSSSVQAVVSRPALASNPYFTEMMQPPMEEQFRSENYPYIYDPISSYEYPVYSQNPEQSVGPTSKHFVVVSFIGLLLLFAIIQNTLLSAKRKEGLLDILSRRKRDLIETKGLLPMSPEQAYILNDDVKLRCIQRTVCSENRKLSKDLGITGKIVAIYLMRSIKEFLDESSGWDRLVEDAGAAGLRGEDCNVLYRDCNLHSSFNFPQKNEQDEKEHEQQKPKPKLKD